MTWTMTTRRAASRQTTTRNRRPRNQRRGGPLMKRAILAGVAAIAVLTLSACTPPIPELPPAPSPSEAAAVVDSQAQRILPETFTELAAADAAKDASLLTNRVGGDAKKVRAAEYKQQKADKKLVPDVIPAADSGRVCLCGRHLAARARCGHRAACRRHHPRRHAVGAGCGRRRLPDARVGAHDPRCDAPSDGGAGNGRGSACPRRPTTVAHRRCCARQLPQAAPRGSQERASTTTSRPTPTASSCSRRARCLPRRPRRPRAPTRTRSRHTDDGTYVMQTADGGALVFAPLA